jgi:2-dehydro-3-deoxygluconokinase
MIEIAGHTRIKSATFDVICAGEAVWAIAGAMAEKRSERVARSMRLRPSGGAVNVALALANAGLRVGLASVLADDAQGRALLANVRAAGVDVRGVVLATPRAGLVLVESTRGGRSVVPFRTDDEPPVSVPEEWSARVLLLSGMSPGVAPAAGLCKAARAARRKGAIVIIDVNARRHAWVGRDPRGIRMVLREADVVRCSTADLAALGIDGAAARGAMRPNATLVVTHGADAAHATGLFGEIRQKPPSVIPVHPRGAGDAFTAAICVELAKAGDFGADRGDLWSRALERGHAAAQAQIQSR